MTLTPKPFMDRANGGAYRLVHVCCAVLAMLIAGTLAVKAQPCSINTSTDVVCLGNSITLSTPTSASDSAWAWDFGDGRNSTQGASVIYQYTAAGSYSPQLTVYRFGGTSCSVVKPVPVKVVNKPTALFQVSSRSLCAKNNQFCLTDVSVPGNSPFVKRIVIFGDGAFDQSLNLTSSTVCHQYTPPAGGRFSVVMQMFDSNGCESSFIDSIVVHPPLPTISFTTSYQRGCKQTPVTFINKSSIPKSQVKHFVWNFKNGFTDTTSWDSIIHVYTTAGTYNPTLIVTDQNNCTDSFTYQNGVYRLTYDTSFTITRLGSSCVNTNKYSFQAPSQSVVVWEIFSPEGKLLVNSTFNPAEYKFPNCGRYKVRFSIRTNVCQPIPKDTFIDIYGPNTIIQDDTLKIRNGNQCGIHDTVYFNTPIRDLSCYHKNGAMQRLWDFGDPYAPACTTDTKNGIFINTNCNFSKDSSGVWHRYKNGKDSCYKVKLVMMDPIRNCKDSDITTLSLMAPDAGWDSTVTPVRRGVYTTGGKCLNETVNFMLEELLPICGPDKVWILPDSSCFPHNWLLKDTTTKGGSYSYTYNSTCSPNGWVTYGVVVSNGLDPLGKRCYDTAWYHNKLYFQPLNGIFTTTTQPVPGMCSKNTATFAAEDSTQYTLASVKWEFGDGQTQTQYFSPGDSIIHGVSHIYQKSGSFTVKCTVTNLNNCSTSTTQQIFLGRHAIFNLNTKRLCNNDPLLITENVGYYSPTGNIERTDYWYDNARSNAGKELLLWDLDDGAGFVKLSKNPVVYYPKAGNYKIRMFLRDSTGCTDTIMSTDTIRKVQLTPNIGLTQTEYLCAPVILIANDSSVMTDSSAAFNELPYDSIVTREWQWDDFKANSLLKNPAHYYTSNGNYTIKLKVTSLNGCVAYDSVPILVKGPQPRFVFTGDTSGCVPFTLTVNNTSAPMLNWIWYFTDTTIYSTTNDSDVTFTYTKPGIYHVRLLGQDNVWNPVTQSYKNCTAMFPDTTINIDIRDVWVIDAPPIEILSNTSFCTGQSFYVSNNAPYPYNKFTWEFEPGSTAIKMSPDTLFEHAFNQPGKKLIKLIATSDNPAGCIDSTTKEVEVTQVEADFDIKVISESKYEFVNKSSGQAVRYEWNFGDTHNEAENRSLQESASHDYKFLPGPHTVCLSAFTTFDCFDSICKTTPITEALTIPNVFSPNNDNQNDAYDIYIQGQRLYELTIYNRWGVKVYESTNDGTGNDGTNWNGKNLNDGSECPSGTYFYTFRYQLLNMDHPITANGTITLLR